MDKRSVRTVIFIALTGVLVLLDQLTKQIALEKLADGMVVPIIPEVLQFYRISNTGAAFGIMKGRFGFFYLITAVVTAAIIFLMARMPEDKKYRPLMYTAAFILAGALGNVIDRCTRHYVVDFIYFKPIDFPVFNVADIYVTCATAVLMFLMLSHYREEDFAFLSLKKGERN